MSEALLERLGLDADGLEDFGYDDQPDGWEKIEGTEEVDPQRWVNLVTKVWSFDGKFYAITLAENTGDGESADAYPAQISQVYPVKVEVTQYVTADPGEGHAT